MGLKFSVSEAQSRSSQAAQVSTQAQQAAASLQQSVSSFLSAPLSSKAYDSAKNYFMVAYTPICQSIIMTGEALANAHKKFLSEYQATVSGLDMDEDKILAEIDDYKALLHTIDELIRDTKTPRPDLEKRSMNVYEAMQKRQEKLEKFRAYSAQSASYFDEYNSSQQELDNGVAQVKDCKAWNAASGTFDIKKLDMNWAKPISTRWSKREKMRQEKLKKAEPTKANTLAKHGLTEVDLVQPNDPESVVFEKYIRLAQMGVNPHTGLPITDKEKWQFQYAAHTKTVFDALGVVGGAYAGNKAFSNSPKKSNSSIKKASGANQKVVEEITNPVLEAPRSGSGLKVDDIKPVKGKGSVYDIDPLTGKPPTKQTQIIIDEFPNVPKAHGFSDIIDNYAGLAEVTDLGNAKLYQIQGSQNGVMGRFEWIIQDGKVTHRMFVRNPELNGVPIK